MQARARASSSPRGESPVSSSNTPQVVHSVQPLGKSTHTHTHTHLKWSRCVTRRALLRRVTARVAMTEASRGLRLRYVSPGRRHVADRAAEEAVQLGWTSFAVVQGRSAQRVLAQLGLGAARPACALHVPARADHAARERRVRPQPVVGRLLLWRLLLWVLGRAESRPARGSHGSSWAVPVGIVMHESLGELGVLLANIKLGCDRRLARLVLWRLLLWCS